MQQLILLVSAAFIYMISLLLGSALENYYFVLNLCVIPIIISGYFFNRLTAILVTAFCCCLSATLAYSGIQFGDILQCILLFICAAAISFIIKKRYKKIISDNQDKIKSLKEKFTAEKTSGEQVTTFKGHLENKVARISELYYSVKRVGSCFTFDCLLNALQDIMAASFKFKSCRLITLYNTEGAVNIDKIYKITKEKVEQTERAGYEDGLLKAMLRKKQLLAIDIRKGKEDSEEFIFPEDFTTFIAAPIIAGDKTNAVLAAEDIDMDHTDHFAILSNQFSMALERIKLYELVQELAITDGLTGVFVRRHLLERLNEEMARADHFKTRVSALMIDVDNFKEYNDKYGHLKGDVLLKSIGGVLKSNVRDIDILGRYGGEEFCVVLPDTDSAGARFVAERLRRGIEDIKATISIGVSTYPEDAKDSSHLIEKADNMLYKAKQAGKNKVCAYEQEQ